MIAKFTPCNLSGVIDAPSSKSMAHRYLLCAALSGQKSVLTGVDFSEDVIATISCLKALGAKIITHNNTVTVEPHSFMKSDVSRLECNESGSTLRFFIPLALTLNKTVALYGSERLFERPLSIYEDICLNKGFKFIKEKNFVTVCGKLESGLYKLRGDVSSQFITGMIFALMFLNKESTIEVIPPFESRPYIDLTISALKTFGADVYFKDEYTIIIKPSQMYGVSARIEGDYSNSAFLDAFNYLGSDVTVNNLNADSLQGDKIYKEYFEKISNGTPTLDISDCPDLGPVLFALAALKNGAIFTGTDRLKAKESDRGKAMHEELKKLGGELVFGDNSITVPKQELKYNGMVINGHNDHRIVMAMSLILSKTGGEIDGAQAVNKSYPTFFDDIKQLGAKVEIVN